MIASYLAVAVGLCLLVYLPVRMYSSLARARRLRLCREAAVARELARLWCPPRFRDDDEAARRLGLEYVDEIEIRHSTGRYTGS